MGKIRQVSAAVAAVVLFGRLAVAETADVGAMAEVRRTVYGVPPAGSQIVKRKGDSVVFKEAIETLDSSGALIRFIDDSKLTLGAKSKVLIDEFVFDPQNAKGNALIEISVGTLRFVTGGMPKGGTVIKTPTATLTLRGTDVTVHVHPDGTTDTDVHDGEVDAHNNVTNQQTNLLPGQGATLGEGGTTSSDHQDDPGDGLGDGNDGNDDNPPEHRRSEPPKSPPPDPAPSTENESEDEDGGCEDGCD